MTSPRHPTSDPAEVGLAAPPRGDRGPVYVYEVNDAPSRGPGLVPVPTAPHWSDHVSVALGVVMEDAYRAGVPDWSYWCSVEGRAYAAHQGGPGGWMPSLDEIDAHTPVGDRLRGTTIDTEGNIRARHHDPVLDGWRVYDRQLDLDRPMTSAEHTRLTEAIGNDHELLDGYRTVLAFPEVGPETPGASPDHAQFRDRASTAERSDANWRKPVSGLDADLAHAADVLRSLPATTRGAAGAPAVSTWDPPQGQSPQLRR